MRVENTAPYRNRRTGQDRRVASYRALVQWCADLLPDFYDDGRSDRELRDLILALRRAPAPSHLDALQADVCAWAEQTFPAATLKTTMTHLRRKLDEIERDPNDATEWAVVFLILLHGSSRFGLLNFSTIERAARAKFEINKTREWGKPDAEGVVEHVRLALRRAPAETASFEDALDDYTRACRIVGNRDARSEPIEHDMRLEASRRSAVLSAHAAAVEEAVAKEREECAMIALAVVNDLWFRERRKIAAAIRGRKP